MTTKFTIPQFGTFSAISFAFAIYHLKLFRLSLFIISQYVFSYLYDTQQCLYESLLNDAVGHKHILCYDTAKPKLSQQYGTN
jgi:hypothetical protein